LSVAFRAAAARPVDGARRQIAAASTADEVKKVLALA
jgi:hypothetical protein